MDSPNPPSVGIGLPVYNNARHLSKTLDSLLNQSYRNISIYISDDCSDDGSAEICRNYAEKDNRILYVRNVNNLGANENHKKVLSLANTEYFMFARGHEVLSRNLIEECINLLENDNKVVLTFVTTKWIDENDNIILNKPIGYFDTRGFDVVTRCILVIWGNIECFYGLTKTKLMRRIRALEEIMSSGIIMLLEMALLGNFAHAQNAYRFRRYHYADESQQKRIKRYKKSTYKKLKKIDYLFPFIRLPYHLCYSIIKSDLSINKKVLAIIVVLVNAPFKYFASFGRRL